MVQFSIWMEGTIDGCESLRIDELETVTGICQLVKRVCR